MSISAKLTKDTTPKDHAKAKNWAYNPESAVISFGQQEKWYDRMEDKMQKVWKTVTDFADDRYLDYDHMEHGPHTTIGRYITDKDTGLVIGAVTSQTKKHPDWDSAKRGTTVFDNIRMMAYLDHTNRHFAGTHGWLLTEMAGVGGVNAIVVTGQRVKDYETGEWNWVTEGDKDNSRNVVGHCLRQCKQCGGRGTRYSNRSYYGGYTRCNSCSGQGVVFTKVSTAEASIRAKLRKAQKIEAANNPATEDGRITALQAALDAGDVTKTDFAQSLVSQYRQKGRLSTKQWDWVQKLATVAPARTDNADIEDLRKVISLLDDRDASFAKSLVRQYDNRGSLSPKQWPWVKKLTDKAAVATASSAGRTKLTGDVGTYIEPATIKAGKTNVKSGYEAVVEFFDRSSDNLKQPKIYLVADTLDPENRTTNTGAVFGPRYLEVLVRAARSRKEDSNLLYVEGYSRRVEDVQATLEYRQNNGLSTWRRSNTPMTNQGFITTYGAINKATGEWFYNTSATDNQQVMSVMEQFRLDPVETTVRLGKKGGRCSFCGAGLHDHRSTSMGYGPTCAKHYKLPWNKAVAQVVDLKVKQAVDLRVLELQPGVWAVVDAEDNSIIATYESRELAEGSMDADFDKVTFIPEVAE